MIILVRELRLLIFNELKPTLTDTHFLNVLETMNELEKLRAKEINRMSIQELESLSYRLTVDQKNKWAGAGYSGKAFVKLVGV